MRLGGGYIVVVGKGGGLVAGVKFERVSKSFGGHTVVKGLDLEVRDGEFLVLVGSSGCGKTTTLRMVAGLEEPGDGTIYIGGSPVNGVPPRDRDIAMVFQNYALYPHMNVYDNMAFGLRMRRLGRQEIDRRVKQAAEMLGIAELLSRRPRELSGGQRQRVALGRAVVRDPRVFLMDEPLSNLDARLRVEMRAELLKLHRRLGTTVIYVTHDQTEAMTMGDRIAVMREGVLEQVAPPEELYQHPKNLYVAGFIGSPAMNFLSCRVEEGEDGSLYLSDGDSFRWRVPGEMGERVRAFKGRHLVLGVRPEHLRPDGQGTDALPATVDLVEALGSEVLVYLSLGRATLVARFPAEARPAVGEQVPISFALHRVRLFDGRTEQAIVA